MTSFDAQLRMADEIAAPITVLVDLTDDRLSLTTDGKRLASWRLSDIKIAPTANGYRIGAVGEEVILTVTNREKFATEIGRIIGTR
jgi:hypothetical protein